METSRIEEGQTESPRPAVEPEAGTSTSDGVTPSKSYSKRQRKPRTWDDFTSGEEVDQKRKTSKPKVSPKKIANIDKGVRVGTVGLGAVSGDLAQLGENSRAPGLSLNISAAIENTDVGSIDRSVNFDATPNPTSAQKKKRGRPRKDVSQHKEVKLNQSESFEESSEVVAPDSSIVAQLKLAVASKRPKLNSSPTTQPMQEPKNKLTETSPKMKGNDASGVTLSENQSGVNISKPKLAGRGRAPKQRTPSAESYVDADLRELRLAQAMLNAGQTDFVQDYAQDIEKKMAISDANIVVAKSKRVRKPKSLNNDLKTEHGKMIKIKEEPNVSDAAAVKGSSSDLTSEKPEPVIENSNRGRKRKSVNYAEMNDMGDTEEDGEKDDASDADDNLHDDGNNDQMDQDFEIYEVNFKKGRGKPSFNSGGSNSGVSEQGRGGKRGRGRGKGRGRGRGGRADENVEGDEESFGSVVENVDEELALMTPGKRGITPGRRGRGRASGTPGRVRGKGRPPKVVDGDSGGKKTGKKQRKDADNFDLYEDEDSGAKGPFNCHHCDFTTKNSVTMKKHGVFEHQIWWTKDIPEGETDKRAITKIIKVRKFLNCLKCDKRLNFAQYYWTHMEWCGREHLMYTCEHCKKQLKLQWEAVHFKSCPALVSARYNEPLIKNEQSDGEPEEETVTASGRKARKAAKKALNMVNKISKHMAKHGPAPEDNSDSDPDVKLDANVTFSDDDDEDLDENLSEEDESPDEIYDDLDDGDVVFDGRTSRPGYLLQFFNVYDLMTKFMKKNGSDFVFPHWLPRKPDWVELLESESKAYLPHESTSLPFIFGNKRGPTKELCLHQAAVIDGQPVFYTGLVIWAIAWCPMPLGTDEEQVLAVVGKLDRTQEFATSKLYSGPGVVQMWKTGIASNNVSMTGKPRPWFYMIHDYGLATSMMWCPFNGYQSHITDTQIQDDSLCSSRLGLLALSFTDGTVRIFSVPNFPDVDSDDDSPTAIPAYRCRPVLTLVSHIKPEKRQSVCSCFDWTSHPGHSKILAGFSDGTVSVFNLDGRSPMLRHKSPVDGLETLAPIFSFQPHSNLLRGVRWCTNKQNMFATSANNFDQFFWDLDSPYLQQQEDNKFYMTICMASSLWQNGVFIAADENYALNWNRSRYIEPRNMVYTMVRRKEELQVYYTSKQLACIWGVSYSNWINMVCMCDNRGRIVTVPLKDMLYKAPDCKTYTVRLDITTTELIMPDKKKEKKKASQSNTCEKCKNNQSKDSSQEAENDTNSNSQSNDSLQKTDTNTSDSNESVTSKSCTCDKTNQSETSDQNGRVDQSDTGTESEQPIELNVSSASENNTEKKMDNSKNGKISGKGCPASDVYTIPKGAKLLFKDCLKEKTHVPDTTDSDDYDRLSHIAIKSIQYNPNQGTCLWVAFGGDTGLIRIVNVRNLVPDDISSTLFAHNKNAGAKKASSR